MTGSVRRRVAYVPKLFAKRSKISFSFTVKKLEQKEKRFMFPDSWANGSSFKIVASRVKVTFLPSILTLRLLFNRCHTAPLPSFSSPFQHEVTLNMMSCAWIRHWLQKFTADLEEPPMCCWGKKELSCVFTAKTLRWAQFSARCFVSAQILSDCQVKSGSATDSYSKIKYIYKVIQTTAVGLMNPHKDSEYETKFKVIFYFRTIFINYIISCTQNIFKKKQSRT